MALIQGGAEKDATNQFGLSSLHYACFEQHEDCATALRNAGCDPLIGDQEGMSLLLAATFLKQTSLAMALLNYPINVECAFKCSDIGMTPLMCCALHGMIEPFLRLLEKGADPMRLDEGDETAGNWACSKENPHCPEMLRAWLAAGGDPNAVDSTGNRLLHDAVDAGPEAVSILLEAGVEADAVNHEGNTPLIYAGMTDFPEVIRLLLDHGADPNAINTMTPSESALVRAKRGGNAAIIQLLEDAGARG